MAAGALRAGPRRLSAAVDWTLPCVYGVLSTSDYWLPVSRLWLAAIRFIAGDQLTCRKYRHCSIYAVFCILAWATYGSLANLVRYTDGRVAFMHSIPMLMNVCFTGDPGGIGLSKADCNYVTTIARKFNSQQLRPVTLHACSSG